MQCSRFLCVVLVSAACAGTVPGQPQVTPTAPPGARQGLVLRPGTGERLAYCERPLVLTLTVDSVTAPTTRLVAGMGKLRGDEGDARHGVVDEILFVVSGWGYATFDGETVLLGPGSVVHVPPGTSHRVVSTAAAPMRYHFVVGPSASAVPRLRREPSDTLNCRRMHLGATVTPGDPIRRPSHADDRQGTAAV